jgi:hypothetical protein
VKDDPALCDEMRLLDHQCPDPPPPYYYYNNDKKSPTSVPVFATINTPEDSLPMSPMTTPMATWRKSHKTVSSIFKPRRVGRNVTDGSSVQQQRQQQQQQQSSYHHSSNEHHQYHPPPYLNVPMLLSSGGSSTIASSSSYAEPYYSWNNTDVRSSSNHHHPSPYSQEHQQQHHSWHSTNCTNTTTPYYFTPPPPPTTAAAAAAAATPSSTTTTSSRSHKTIRFMDDEPQAQMLVKSSISRTLSETNMMTMMIHKKSNMEISPELRGEYALHNKGELYHQQQQQPQYSDAHCLHSLPMEVVETGYQYHHTNQQYPRHHHHHHQNTTNRSGFVSRRGRRPPGTMLISRNATH